jgi:DNA-binding MarR family transcriptional regulator
MTPDTTDSPAGANPAGRPPQGGNVMKDRATLERELLEEMTAWPPRDRGGALRNWHRHALSLVHLTVLTALEAEGPLSMKRLAEAMDVSDASATGIVDRMEKRGLVERRHGTTDRRMVLVHPTDTGSQVFTNIAAHRQHFLARVFHELSEDEVFALLTGMRAMHAARTRVLAAEAGDRDDSTTDRPPATSPASQPTDS